MSSCNVALASTPPSCVQGGADCFDEGWSPPFAKVISTTSTSLAMDSLPFCLHGICVPASHRGGARPGNWRVMRSPAAVRIPASPPTVSPIRPYPHISLSCSPLLLGMQDTANSHHPSSDKNCTAMAATKLRRSLCAEVLKTLRRPRPDAVSAAPAIESP